MARESSGIDRLVKPLQQFGVLTLGVERLWRLSLDCCGEFGG
jgi:hypothetical protein